MDFWISRKWEKSKSERSPWESVVNTLNQWIASLVIDYILFIDYFLRRIRKDASGWIQGNRSIVSKWCPSYCYFLSLGGVSKYFRRSLAILLLYSVCLIGENLKQSTVSHNNNYGTRQYQRWKTRNQYGWEPVKLNHFKFWIVVGWKVKKTICNTQE